jgi:isopentenyl diphosphate isomerase/L-lactate dehydrogenase-like FMN-dependent dehydrogenase
MIIVDGGFYRGTDIVKAIALGANLVGLGRMQCYGLAAAGQAGIVRMLEIMEDEVTRCARAARRQRLRQARSVLFARRGAGQRAARVLGLPVVGAVEPYRY